MSGHHPCRELTKDFSPERQARIADKVRLLQHAMTLAELRQARQQAQADMAARLQVKAPAHQLPLSTAGEDLRKDGQG